MNISDCTSHSGYVCFSPVNSHNKECFNKIKRNHVFITSYIKTGFLCDLMTTVFFFHHKSIFPDLCHLIMLAVNYARPYIHSCLSVQLEFSYACHV